MDGASMLWPAVREVGDGARGCNEAEFACAVETGVWEGAEGDRGRVAEDDAVGGGQDI